MNQESLAPGNPMVSVILPTYNRAHLICRAIESVLQQTYTDLELIIIDDDSNDNTEEVVKSFKDPRLRFVRHDENKGGGAARNTGIMAAKGKYIAFQDSDDEWLPSKLAVQVGVMEKASPDVGVVYSGWWRVDKGKKDYVHYRRVANRSGNIHRDLLRRNFVTTPTILARREPLLKSGLFDERLPRLQDWELVIRLSRDCEFLYLDEPLVISHLSPDSISRDTNAVTMALELILDKHHCEFDSCGVMSNHCYLLSRLLLSNHQYGKGLHYLIAGIKRNPRSVEFLMSILALLPLGSRVYDEIVGIVGR